MKHLTCITCDLCNKVITGKPITVNGKKRPLFYCSLLCYENRTKTKKLEREISSVMVEHKRAIDELK